jgi:hypothetical protein
LGDLEANPAIADGGGYLVRDAFVDEDGAVHVELVSMRDIVEGGRSL